MKKEANKLDFDARPSFGNFRAWRKYFCSEVPRGSNRPVQAIPWVNEIENSKNWDTRTLRIQIQRPKQKTASWTRKLPVV